MEQEKESKTLAERICAVMADLERVPKRGRNQFHGYDYATESDVADALRPLLAKHGLAVIPSVESVERRGVETRSGHATYVTVTLRVALLGGGEQYVTYWQGDAVDGGDKAVYKAYTGAYKYALLRTFCASSGDTDAEQAGPGDEVHTYVVKPVQESTSVTHTPDISQHSPGDAEHGNKEKKQKEKPTNGISIKQQYMLKSAAESAGVSVDELKKHVRETYGTTVPKMSNKQLDEVLKWLAEKKNEVFDDLSLEEYEVVNKF